MPPLTDAQQRTDAALDQLVERWNALGDAQKRGPAGAGIRQQIADMVRQRNGDAAARDVSDALGRTTIPLNPAVMRDDLDDRFPRSDAAPAPAAPPAPTPAAAPVATGGVYTAAPGDGRLWLPGNAALPQMSDADDAALNALDAGVEALNQQHFRVDPALAWHPEGARLPTGTNISTLGQTYDRLNEFIPRFRAKIEALAQAFEGTGEYLINEQLERMRGTLKALSDAGAASASLPGLVARAGTAANDAFHQMRGEALDARTSIATRVQWLENAHEGGQQRRDGRDRGDIVSRGAFTQIPPVATDLDKVAVAQQRGRDIAALAAALPVPERIDGEAVGDGRAPDSVAPERAMPMPAPASPALPSPGGTAPPPADRGASSDRDDLATLLASLAGTPGGVLATPQMPNPATAAQQAAKPLQQAAQQAAQAPQDLLDALRGAGPENQRHQELDSGPAADAAAADRKAATAAFVPPGAAAPGGLGMPGSDARPHQLDANGRPADKNGDGKVDRDATPLSKRTVRPFDLSVPADGKNVQVQGIPDPRVGEMMLTMADADDDRPVAVLDAARASGMPIDSLGDPKDPSQVEVGDAVIGAVQSGIYLGQDLVLTSTGAVMDLVDVLGDAGDGFVADIPLPELPDDVPGEGDDKLGEPDGPAVPQTGPPIEPVTHTSGDDAPPPAVAAAPAAAPAQPEPATAAPLARPAVSDPPAPAPAPAPEPAPPPGQPVQQHQQRAASDDLPRQVAYQGRALG